MTITVAQLNSGAWDALGQPTKDLIDLGDIHYQTRGVVTLLTKQIRSSDNNQQLAVTDQFTATANPYDITGLIGSGTPAWLEMLQGEWWNPVRTVNRAFLEEQYLKGIMASAFWGTITGTQYVQFSFALSITSSRVFRIQYDPDAIDTAMREPVAGIQIPDSFRPYIELKIVQPCIKQIIRNLAKNAKMDGVDGKTLEMRIQSWNDTFQYNKDELIPEWRQQFDNWKNRSRTAQNESRLPARSGRGFYGG